jgi:predicted MFS family arabinose efflux permease
MLVGVIGSLMFAAAPSFVALAVGRALIGVGMAGILIGGFKAISQWYPEDRFATATGLLTGIGSVGALVAATPLAWLNQTIGWRAVFVMGSFVIAIIALAIVLWTRNSPPGVAWTGGGQTESNLRTVFSSNVFWRIAPLAAFVGGAFGAFRGLWAGPYLFDGFRLNEIAVGNLLLLIGIGSIVGFITAGWLSDRFGLTRPAVAFGLLFLICQLSLAIQPPLPVVGVIYVLFGFSSGLLVVLVAHTRSVFPATMTGQALSMVNLFAFGGTFLLQLLMGVIIGAFPLDASGHYSSDSYATALIFTLIGSLLTFIWYLPLGRTTDLSSVKVS